MRKVILPISIVLIFSLSSCYPEWKLAKTYIESKPNVSLLVLPTDYVFKNNLKSDEIGDTAGMSPLEVDSALQANSLFLKDLADSIFLENFVNSLIEELESLGFSIYLDQSADSFLFFQSPSYILNIAQIELDEHYFEYLDEEMFGDTEYYKKLNTNAVTFNFWIELTQLNPKKEGRKLFYTSETIADAVEGYFSQNLFTGEVKYSYNIRELDMDVIYRYCSLLGEKYAGYTFDYLMNQYISQNFPQGQKRHFYMHYNRSNRTLDPTFDDRFEIME